MKIDSVFSVWGTPVNLRGVHNIISFLVCSTGQGVDGSSCSACAVGKYKDSVGNTACTDCPSGKSTTSTGSTALSDCGR